MVCWTRGVLSLARGRGGGCLGRGMEREEKEEERWDAYFSRSVITMVVQTANNTMERNRKIPMGGEAHLKR